MRALAKDLKVKLPGASIRTDEDIAGAALSALKWDVEVPDQRLKVEVEDGCVTLLGEVDWHFQAEAAVNDVRKLAGVSNVINNITVKPTASPSQVRSQIESALQRRAVKDARKITVQAEGGRVTLRGEVHSWAEREDAERAAWAAPGVLNVDDQIHIQI
jgi:osmotically-inducible protein OsmY